MKKQSSSALTMSRVERHVLLPQRVAADGRRAKIAELALLPTSGSIEVVPQN
jgi:hypothetical protein